MSVNRTFSREREIIRDGLEAIIGEYVLGSKTAATEEERSTIEGELVGRFEYLMQERFDFPDVLPGDSLLLEPVAQAYRTIYDLTRMNRAQLQTITDHFVEYHNTREALLLDLQGKARRVQQKRAALNLWDNNTLYALADDFFNRQYLSTELTSEEPCEVHPTQGVLTLPILSEDVLTIKNVSLGTGSNGTPGNSNEEVDLRVNNPAHVFDGDENTWFEYERLDSGPCKLVLKVHLSTPQFINKLRLEPLNLGAGYAFEVEDVALSASSAEATSIKDRIATTLPKDFWVVDTTGSSKDWSLVFVPVLAQVVTFTLRQRAPTQVLVATADDRTVSRNRYAIGIKRLEVIQQKYAEVGSISSLDREYSGSLYVSTPVVSVFPPNQTLYKLNLETTLDSGSTWHTSETYGEGPSDTILLDGDGGYLAWRTTLKRQSEAFSQVQDFLEKDLETKDVSSVLRTVSKAQSPAAIALKERPKSSRVFAMQTQLGRRGDKYKSVYLGQGVGDDVSFELPFSLLDHDLDPEELRVFANRREYTYNADNSALGANEWSFSDDFREVEVGSGLSSNSIIRMSFRKERMLFEERSDGFYHKSMMLFDPDQENIVLELLPRDGIRATHLIPRHQEIIRFPHRYLEDDTFQLQSSDGILYSEQVTRLAVTTISNSYYVNYKDGVMWLNSATGSDQIRVSYRHHTPKELDSSQYKIVYDGLAPRGFLVAPEAMEAQSVTDAIHLAATRRYDPVTGDYGVKGSPYGTSADASNLSYDYLVAGSVQVGDDLLTNGLSPEEVPYIDGKTEFLGLIPVENEKTVEIAPTGGLVQFTLGAGALVHYEYDVLFENTTVFALKQPTIPSSGDPNGEYYIDPDTGLVTIALNYNLPAGIGINYYYRDPNFVPDNKFSVDYKYGYVYGYSDLTSGAEIKYKATAGVVSYDIGREIDTYSLRSGGNIVDVRTEGLRETNGLVKVLWEREGSDADLRASEEYFSPIITRIGYRFH